MKANYREMYRGINFRGSESWETEGWGVNDLIQGEYYRKMNATTLDGNLDPL